MATSYGSITDDFGVSCYLLGKVDMPSSRETVLHFFESVKKAVPTMTDFDKRDNGEYALEEDREPGNYRWVSLDTRRLALGYANPPAMEDADEHCEQVLEMASAHLDLGGLQTEAIDVMYYFDFLYQGNHDEIVAEALAGDGPLEGLIKIPGGRVLNYQPTLMLALDESCQLQARMNIETRTTAYQVRTGTFSELPISVYFTLRQFWGKQPFKSFIDSYRNQRRLLDELVTDYVIPNVLQPIARTIGAKQ
ncbi:hypothetical protein BH11PLA2_BH11PLA2_49040 [soil metagenome]